MLSSRQFILLMRLMIFTACAPARTYFKGLGRVGVAVCGPDGFTSINEGGVGEEVTFVRIVLDDIVVSGSEDA
jgi:hypothetical protein